MPYDVNQNNLTSERNYNFIDWYFKCLRNYFKFSGRACRQEYWNFTLINILIILLAIIIDYKVFNQDGGWLYGLSLLGLIIPFVAVTVRRLHDVNHSGWWILIPILPFIGYFKILVLMGTKSDPNTNHWGPPNE